jgi:hypothetical protein
MAISVFLKASKSPISWRYFQSLGGQLFENKLQTAKFNFQILEPIYFLSLIHEEQHYLLKKLILSQSFWILRRIYYRLYNQMA